MKSGLFDDAPAYLGQCLRNDRKVYGVILFASWSLTNIERRYSQKKKEALALVWTCERFGMCMSGESFELETDHKLLEPIHSRSSKPCARIERSVLCLQGYDFVVVNLQGKANIADALWRQLFEKS